MKETQSQRHKCQIKVLPALTDNTISNLAKGWPRLQGCHSPGSWDLALTFRMEVGSVRFWPDSSFSNRWRLLATPAGVTRTSVREEPGDLTDSDLCKIRDSRAELEL